MKALYLDGSGLSLRELAPPTRRAGEALVRVRMAGVCRTDLELARGYMSFTGVLGHEFVGDVLEAEDASLVGARVTGEINLSCGACALCTRGLPRHCSERTVLGILGKDGCLAEYLTLPEKNLHRVPDALDDRAACFAEPIAACFEIFEQLALAPGDRIAVLGDGKLGQLIALVLRSRGLAPLLVGKHLEKLARAASAGIHTAGAEGLRHKSYDVVVDATGSPSGMQLALQLLRPRGTLVLKSTYHGQLSLDAAVIVIDEISVVGSRCGPFPPALDALGTGAVDPAPLVDAMFPLEDALAAMRRAGGPGVMKVLVHMGPGAPA